MVRRSAGERVAPCERRERPFAAEIADRFVNRGDAFARHDVDLAIVAADQQLTLEPRAIVAEIFGVGRGIADRKSTRLNPVTNAQLVCSLLPDKKNKINFQEQ